MAKVVKGQQQPVRPRAPAVPAAGSGGGNYFAGVVDELRKVVWPTWNELGRMTGVVVTTVVLMAVIVSAADYGLGFVVRQLYTSNTSSAAGTTNGSTVSAQPSVAASAHPSAAATSAASASPASTAPAGSSPAINTSSNPSPAPSAASTAPVTP